MALWKHCVVLMAAVWLAVQVLRLDLLVLALLSPSSLLLLLLWLLALLWLLLMRGGEVPTAPAPLSRHISTLASRFYDNQWKLL